MLNTRWLFYQVTGCFPPRKPPKRSNGRGPARNGKYRAWIRTLPCAACGATEGIEAAHTGSDGGTSMKASDYSCIPLCAECHRFGPQSYHQLGRDQFEQVHSFICREMVKRLNHTWFAFSRLVK